MMVWGTILQGNSILLRFVCHIVILNSSYAWAVENAASIKELGEVDDFVSVMLGASSFSTRS